MSTVVTRPAAAGLAAALAMLVGCAGYTGAGRVVDPASVRAEAGWQIVDDVPVIRQRSLSDCGAAALAMVAARWQVDVDRDAVVAAAPPEKDGIKLAQLRDVATRHGLRAFAITATLADLDHEIERGRPVIIGLIRPHGSRVASHFEVVVAVDRARGRIATIDPSAGWRVREVVHLEEEWQPAGRPALVVLGP